MKFVNQSFSKERCRRQTKHVSSTSQLVVLGGNFQNQKSLRLLCILDYSRSGSKGGPEEGEKSRKCFVASASIVEKFLA